MFYYASYHKRLHIVNSKRQFFTRNFAKSLLRNSYSYGMLTQNVNYLTIMNHKISKGGQDMQKRKNLYSPAAYILRTALTKLFPWIPLYSLTVRKLLRSFQSSPLEENAAFLSVPEII